MKTEEYLNTEEIDQFKNTLKRVNDEIKNAYKNIKKIKNNLMNNEIWKGKAAEHYDYKFQVISDRYNERVVPVDKYIEQLQGVIDGYIDTEAMNKKIGKSFDDSNAALKQFD